jgi:arylformamidase
MYRRDVLAGLGVLSSGIATRSFAAPAPVFLDYTQEQLDEAYDQSFWVSQMAEYEGRDTTASAAVRKAMPPRVEQYGPNDTDLVDIFALAGARGAPVMVYIHGGAWIRNTREDASYSAPTFVGKGAAYLAPDFGSLHSVRLPHMVASCQLALEWTVRNAARFGGDPNRVFIAGHSSGAHLAACVLLTDWTKRGLPADAIKGALLMSGLYDMYPVMLSSRREFVHITPEEEAALSPARHLDRITCPIAVLSGDGDSPEFKRQSSVFADMLRGMGKLHSRTVVFAANHFQEAEQLGRPDSQVSQVALSLIGV